MKSATQNPKSPLIPVYPYQQRWLDDKSRFKLWVKSVQIGASFVQCMEAVMDCAKSREKNSKLWILLSASERQALELARTCKQICQAARIVAELRENEFFHQTLLSQHRLEFPNGARILALPANPDTARGYAGNVVLDEFAIHRDAREIWRAAFGRASRGYKIRVLSSPKGQTGKFYELAKELGLTAPPANPQSAIAPRQSAIAPRRAAKRGRTRQSAIGNPQSAIRNPKSPWSGHWTDIYLAVGEGCPLQTEELRGAVGDEDTWMQEYCCVFLSDSENFLPLELIASCESAEATREFDPKAIGHKPDAEYFFGFDVGRKRDLSVLVVIEKLGDVCWVRQVRELAQASFRLQEQAIAEACQICVRGCMDATGIGQQMAERMREQFGARVEPVQFTLQVKQDLAVRARRLFEERRARIPDYAPLRRDLCAVKRLITPAGARQSSRGPAGNWAQARRDSAEGLSGLSGRWPRHEPSFQLRGGAIAGAWRAMGIRDELGGTRCLKTLRYCGCSIGTTVPATSRRRQGNLPRPSTRGGLQSSGET